MALLQREVSSFLTNLTLPPYFLFLRTADRNFLWKAKQVMYPSLVKLEKTISYLLIFLPKEKKCM